jgi:hypothetical protein
MLHDSQATQGLLSLALARRGLAPTRIARETETVERRQAAGIGWLQARFVAAALALFALAGLNNVWPPQA